jgi:hypothetical protein
MTVQEAKMQIQAIPSKIWEQLSPCDNEAMGIAIECMEELEQYRALGTVEELKEAREKQVAKKPIEYEDKYYACPRCEGIVMYKWDEYPTKLKSKKYGLPYCLGCGQKLDWSEEDD